MLTRIHVYEAVLSLLFIRVLVIGFKAQLFHEVLEGFYNSETRDEIYLNIMKTFNKEIHEIKTSNAIQI